MKKRYHSWFRSARPGRPQRAFLWNSTFQDGVMIFWGMDGKTLCREWLYCHGTMDTETKECLADMRLAKFFSKNGTSLIAFRNKHPSQGVIAHEALHYVHYLMDGRGIPYSEESDECHAYLLQWVVQNIHDLNKTHRFTQ